MKRVRRKGTATTTPAPTIPVKPPPRKKPPKIDPRPPATTTTTTAPQPKPTIPDDYVLGAPTGIISGPLRIAYGRGGPWETVNAHDPFFLSYGKRYGVLPSMLKAMEVIESGGEMIPNVNGYPNWGNMQLTSREFGAGYTTPWDDIAKKLGVSIKSAEGQIAIAAYALGGHHIWKGTPEQIFLANYYPIDGGLDVPGPDGHTQRQYLDDMQQLMRQIDAAAAKPPAEAPRPKPTQQDVLNLISNNFPGVYISFGYGELNTGGGNFYTYGVGHMDGRIQNANIHPGIDIWMPDETPVNAVFGGEVICVGGQGRVLFDQGCGYFSDDDGGIGKISILTNAYVTIKGKRYQMAMVYGHMSTSYVRVGQHIANGERIGRSGVANRWPHIHLDVSINAPELNNPAIQINRGVWHLLDPMPAILNALGGGTIVLPVERVPYDFEHDPNVFTVEVTKDGVPVRQRADPKAPELDGSPYTKGDTFEAIAIVPGNDGKGWWLGRLNGRVPMDGTKGPMKAA